jgi:dolichyl-phosphate-mannose-protein mannosyltransferase
MTLSEKPVGQSTLWFRWGLVGLLIGSLGLRFWGLGRINGFVFDEVYYVKFAHNYLTHTPFFDGHPPLSKYLIAIGIWLGNQLPIGQDTVNTLAGSALSTWSYRWLNAFTGAWIPLVVAAIAYQLSQRRSYALIAGLLAGADGLFLVESRYALNNVYLVLLGLLGQLGLLLAVRAKAWQRDLWLVFAGLGFGAAAAIKWNGLWFLLGAYLLYGLAWLLRLGRRWLLASTAVPEARSPWHRLSQINPILWLLYLGMLPAVVYYLLWIPHLQMNPGTNFVNLQWQILTYHENITSKNPAPDCAGAQFNLLKCLSVRDPDIHPYCSTWYSWILMLRPVAYFYQIAANAQGPIPVKSAIKAFSEGNVIYDVHAIGNPILWWLSTVAIGLFVGAVLWHLVARLRSRLALATASELNSGELWVGFYVLANYAANLLPWTRVTRCSFLYHYMGASVFATLALAWWIDRAWHSRQAGWQMTARFLLALVLIGFAFWMPIYLGLPLALWQYQLRMWLPTWI